MFYVQKTDFQENASTLVVTQSATLSAYCKVVIKYNTQIAFISVVSYNHTGACSFAVPL